MCSHKKTRWIPNTGRNERPMPILIYNDEVVNPKHVGGKVHALLLCKTCGTTEIDDTTATLRLVAEMKERRV